MGYIGLPTASIFANNGFNVVGVDVNPSVVDVINRGEIHIEEPGLNTLVQAAVHSGRLRADLMPVPADVFIIAVPTPVTEDHRADMSYVETAMRSIIPVLRKGNLVILESTSPPGTTRDLLAPLIQDAGFKVGEDIFLAHCPERVLPGRILKELIENHRVVGGMTAKCAEKAKALYAHVVQGDIHLADATTAEMVKVMENTYRDVNIALANELARISENLEINAWEVVRLANLHPRVNLHRPGPGVGGHCISVDPWFIVERCPDIAKIIATARQINDSMPLHVVKTVKQIISSDRDPRVTLLGLAYKPDVDDMRESPALEVASLLRAEGIDLKIHDPFIRQSKFNQVSLEDAFDQSDLVILLTAHSEYKSISPDKVGNKMRKSRVLDCHNALSGANWRHAGFEFHLLGEKSRSLQNIPDFFELNAF